MSFLSKDDECAIAIAASTLILSCATEQLTEQLTKNEKWQQNRKKRKCWVKSWLACRESMGAYHALVLEFSLTEHDEYHRFMWMDPETFKVNELSYHENFKDNILSKISSKTGKNWIGLGKK